jgi:hypothetical protein
MATKDKNGNWIFDDDEQAQIAMGAESRYQAMKRRDEDKRRERIEQDCADGKHVAEDGKCKHCGTKVEPAQPARKKFGLVR